MLHDMKLHAKALSIGEDAASSDFSYAAGIFGEELAASEAAIQAICSAVPSERRADLAVEIGRVIRLSSEEALRRLEERLQLAQEVGRIGCFEIDMRDGSSVGTPAFFALYGLLPGKGAWRKGEWMSFVHPEDRPRVIAHLKDVARGADLTAVEYRIVRTDGEVRYTASRARVETGPDGTQIRAYGIQHDITELKTAEAALATREKSLRLALEAVGDAAWDWNLEKRRITISGRHIRALGYGKNRFDGSIESMSDIIHPDDVAAVGKKLRRHLAGRTRHFAAEFRLRTRGGEWRSIISRGRVIERDPISGWAIRMVGTSTDVEQMLRVSAT
jgi:PAS domain S-box-containing protein